MKKGLSQEALKSIACLTMLIDHIGAVIVLELYRVSRDNLLLELYTLMRTIGRVSFPVYCFLLVEGALHTQDPKSYRLRLIIGALLSEIPYDLAFYGHMTWEKQNVMMTLLLGLCAMKLMEKYSDIIWKLIIAIPFALVAKYLRTDYGSNGIMLILLFAFTRDLPHKHLWQLLGLWFVFSPGHLMALNWINGFSVTIQEWAVLAMVPIGLYNGEKRSRSKVLQWGFYLFYPAHLLALYGASLLLG